MKASDCPDLGIPKGPTRKTSKRAKRREEVRIIAENREACVERDGYCRFANLLHICKGPSEWAHRVRRSQTRGLPADVRHQTGWTLMLCQWLHREFDAHRAEIEPMTDDGCNGGLMLKAWNGVAVTYPKLRSVA